MSELVTLVDENDNEIGTKARELLSNEDRWRIVTIWVLNSKNELLIAKRSMNKVNNPGKWGPSVVGTVEHGEDYEETALREMQEEIGITAKLQEKKLVMHAGNVGARANKNFIARVDLPIEAFILQEEEVDAIAWVSISDLLQEINDLPDKYWAGMEAVIGIIEDE